MIEMSKYMRKSQQNIFIFQNLALFNHFHTTYTLPKKYVGSIKEMLIQLIRSVSEQKSNEWTVNSAV